MKRDLGKADEIFDVPAINFFTSGNDYFGFCATVSVSAMITVCFCRPRTERS